MFHKSNHAVFLSLFGHLYIEQYIVSRLGKNVMLAQIIKALITLQSYMNI